MNSLNNFKLIDFEVVSELKYNADIDRAYPFSESDSSDAEPLRILLIDDQISYNGYQMTRAFLITLVENVEIPQGKDKIQDSKNFNNKLEEAVFYLLYRRMTKSRKPYWIKYRLPTKHNLSSQMTTRILYKMVTNHMYIIRPHVYRCLGKGSC